jgi:hypothetical protein
VEARAFSSTTRSSSRPGPCRSRHRSGDREARGGQRLGHPEPDVSGTRSSSSQRCFPPAASTSGRFVHSWRSTATAPFDAELGPGRGGQFVGWANADRHDHDIGREADRLIVGPGGGHLEAVRRSRDRPLDRVDPGATHDVDLMPFELAPDDRTEVRVDGDCAVTYHPSWPPRISRSAPPLTSRAGSPARMRLAARANSLGASARKSSSPSATSGPRSPSASTSRHGHLQSDDCRGDLRPRRLLYPTPRLTLGRAAARRPSVDATETAPRRRRRSAAGDVTRLRAARQPSSPHQPRGSRAPQELA